MSYTIEQVWESLKKVRYPDGNADIVTLNMVESIKIEGNKISFSVFLPVFNSPFKKSIEKACIRAIKDSLGEEVEVDATITSKITVGRMDKTQEEILPGVKILLQWHLAKVVLVNPQFQQTWPFRLQNWARK
jgi:ATP-binding protein involved in chromosome partitioning